MHRVPVVGAPASLAAQVRSDPPRPEHHGPLQLILIFLGLRNRSPASLFIGDRPHELAVAMPAAFTDIDLPPVPERLDAVVAEPLLALQDPEAAGHTPQ